MSTLQGAFRRAALTPVSVRFVQRDEAATSVTYAELYRGACAVARSLAALGLRPGEAAAIILPTCAGFYHAFFGTLLMGGIPVPMYPPMRLGKLDEYHAHITTQLERVRAGVVLTQARLRHLVGQAARSAATRCSVANVAALVHDGSLSTGPAEQADAGGRDDGLHLGTHDETAVIQFSSGTTTAPKAVALSHRQILANIQAIAQCLNEAAPPAGGGKHTAVSWLPLYHDMGLVGSLLTAMFEQTALTLIAPQDFIARPALWLRTIARYGASVSAAPNFAYSLCAERIADVDLEGIDLTPWQVALNGAEHIRATTLERFAARFAPFGFAPHAMTPVYGLAEAALAVTFSAPARPPVLRKVPGRGAAMEGTGEGPEHADGGLESMEEALVSVGKPLAGYSLQIVDADAMPVEPGQVGEIWVRGPSVMQGYIGGEGHALRQGWLATGDLGLLDAGELYVVGRRKDVIIIRGRNIAPQDVERIVETVPGVRRGCVVAASAPAPTEAGGSEVLYVLAEHQRRGGRLDAKQVCAQIRAAVTSRCHIAPYAVEVCVPGTLPRTSSGKLRRQDALRMYLAGSLRPPRRAPLLRWAAQMVRAKLVP